MGVFPPAVGTVALQT